MEGINPAIRILVSCNLNFNSTDRNPQKQLQDFRIWINALFTPTPAVNTRKGTAKLNHGEIERDAGIGERGDAGRDKNAKALSSHCFWILCLPSFVFSNTESG